ncbi:MAG: glycosyltransferase [Clostridia bacterium]|nr:glycosyltransferase [Clostridia bacterium]
MGKKVSIIIPVYNSKQYLPACVDSIISQSWREIEIILVDDGSTDGSAALCDELAQKDARIVVIHQPNGGTSAARNTGLEHASGDYVTFIDNDDYWNRTDALECMMERLAESDADMMLFDSIIYWADTDKTVPPSSGCKREAIAGRSPAEAILHFTASNVFSAYCVWGKLVRTSIIRENQLRFPIGMRNEDIDFCADLFRLCKSYDWYEDAFYVYRKGHTGAQTKQRITYQMLNDLKTVLLRQIDRAKALPTDHQKALLSYLSFPYAVWMGQSKLVKDERVAGDLPEMKQYRYLLQESNHPSVRLVYRVSRLLGFGGASRLLAIYLKRNNHLE